MTLLQIFLEAISEPEVQAESLNIFDLIVKGGIIMIPIFMLSFLSIYIMVERYYFITKAAKADKNFTFYGWRAGYCAIFARFGGCD